MPRTLFQFVRTTSMFVVCLIIGVGSLSLISYTTVNAMPGVQYLSPIPGSQNVSQQSNIIVRMGPQLDRLVTTDLMLFSVQGTKSGTIDGKIILSDDEKTLIFLPSKSFLPDEKIFVSIKNGIRSLSGEYLNPLHFEFTVSPLSTLEKETLDRNAAEVYFPEGQPVDVGQPNTVSSFRKTVIDTISPLPIIKVSDQPAPGDIFLSTWKGMFTFTGGAYFPSDNQYLMIIDNTNQPIFLRQTEQRTFDFRVLPNGSLVYFDENTSSNVILDHNYTVIDNYACGNGYKTDPHDFLLLPNGHVLLLGLDPQTVDMSTIVDGGNPKATVIGFVVQELDHAKNIVFQWRSFDHFKITDATHEDLTAATIDYGHPNALAIDADSNIILSDRHMDEITKIDRTTGDILWRWGGKNNQFTFINDTLGFSHQHSINLIDNGDFTLFDNGNFHTPSFSRALEYKLDEQAKTATLVWQYRHTPDVFTVAMGSVERLPNGNTFIGWGAAGLAATEVRPDGSTAYEIQLPDSIFSYRALKYQWNNTTSVSTHPEVPATYSLYQNYPNPFNPSTNIEFSLPESRSVSLKVYDMLGKEVASLMNKTMLPGTYTVQWNAGNASSGVYFYRLIAGSYSMTKKLLLLR
jgi:hypothetical protein